MLIEIGSSTAARFLLVMFALCYSAKDAFALWLTVYIIGPTEVWFGWFERNKKNKIICGWFSAWVV